MLFQETIAGWESWGKIFQSREAFAPLVEEICRREGMPFSPFLNCTPGTNAVFEAGGRIVKVFAPLESGLDTLPDYQNERFGLARAKELALPAPRLLAQGEIRDRCLFRYLILEKLGGLCFAKARKEMDDTAKRRLGRQLREMTKRLNTPCPPWKEEPDLIARALDNPRWAPFPESFNRERRAYTMKIALTDPVYVHGDINEDNLFILPDGSPALIDFADAGLAPVFYEHALIMSELFWFERPLIAGFFGDTPPQELARLCLSGLLLHDFGGNVLCQRLGDIASLVSLQALFTRLCGRLNA